MDSTTSLTPSSFRLIERDLGRFRLQSYVRPREPETLVCERGLCLMSLLFVRRPPLVKEADTKGTVPLPCTSRDPGVFYPGDVHDEPRVRTQIPFFKDFFV